MMLRITLIALLVASSVSYILYAIHSPGEAAGTTLAAGYVSLIVSVVATTVMRTKGDR